MIGELVAGKYRVERVLGHGAMGVVYAARHATLDHVVAIKLLGEQRFGTREASIERFLREARAAARIESDHVARVFDVGTLPDGVPYMVMEYLEGNDLDTELASRGPLPIGEAVDWVRAAADAIAAAHQHGVVHRDLKPANLFLARRADGVRVLKVLDFGISKPNGGGAVAGEAGSVGTPAYMSPEQIGDPASVDGKTDIWALGVILFELVTGQIPFEGHAVHEVLERIVAGDACNMHALRRDVSPELETIVMRCLARDRSQRWATADELGGALGPFGMRGSAPPPSSTGAVSVRNEVDTQPDPYEVSGAVPPPPASRFWMLIAAAAFVACALAFSIWKVSQLSLVASATAATPPPPASVQNTPIASASASLVRRSH